MAIAIITLLTFGAGIWWVVDRDTNNRHKERIETVIETYDMAVSQEIAHVEAIADSPLITQAIDDPNGLSRFYLNSYLSSVDVSRSFQPAISAYQSNGRLISTNKTLDANYLGAVSDKEWFTQTLESQKTTISVSAEGVIFAAPIMIKQEARGIVISELNHLGPWFNLSFDDAAIVIVDNQNNLLYSSNEQAFPPLKKLDDFLTSQWKQIDTTDHGELKILSLEQASRKNTELRERYFLLLLATAFIFLSGIICAAVAGKIADRLISEFIRAIDHFEKHQELGALNHRVFEIQEIQQLKVKFQRLLHNLVVTNLSKERVSALMNSLNDMLVVFDLDGNPILSNKSFDDFFTDKEFDEPDILTFLFHHSNENQNLLDMDTPLEPFERDYTSGLTHHHHFIIQWKRNPLLDDQGRIIGAIFVGQDVTKSNELTTENELKEAAIDGADSGILILETDADSARIRYANPSFHKLTGIKKRRLIGRDVNLYSSRLFPKAPLIRIKRAIDQNQSIIEIIHVKFIHGSTGHIEFNFSPIPVQNSSKKKYYLCLLKDVTQQQLTSKLLIEAKRRAEESAKLKSQFLASMSHEIRTPMNGVIGMLEILNDSPLNAQQINYVRIAQGSAESLLHIINDILDFSKIEAGKATINKTDFKLCEMFEDFIDSMAHLAHNKGLELVLDITQVNNCMVKGDSGRLRQILTNLVGNAIKFTEQGGILLKAEVQPKDQDYSMLQVSVSDSGRGIPLEHQQSLFEPFTQVDVKPNERHKGTGLGLAIVKQLVENMGGDISLISEQGKGSTFNFEIQVEPSTLVTPPVETSALEGKRILLIDDNELARKNICKQVKQWGIQVKSFDNGHDAFDFIQTQNTGDFDAAIIDADMPGMSGMQLGQKLKANNKADNLNMLLMTSFRKQLDTNDIKQAGFKGYFSKPVKSRNLIDALNLLFKEHQVASEVITDKLIGELRQEITFKNNYRVLLVEDNVVNQMISKKFIESAGLQTIIKADGRQAIDALKNGSETFDLIVMDCQMPIIDGFTAARMIRSGEAGEQYRSTPIIAMTANVLEEDKDRCIEAGMSDYLPKPLRREQLVKTLKKWLQ